MKKCRIWWPYDLVGRTCAPDRFDLLFGWFFSPSSVCIDIVVAFACDTRSLTPFQCDAINGSLHDTNSSMPILLQGKSTFSILGLGTAHSLTDAKLIDVNNAMLDKNGKFMQNGTFGIPNCRCCKIDVQVEQCCLSSFKNGDWVFVVYQNIDNSKGKVMCVPQLHHIHWSNQTEYLCDIHVIIYETPQYGLHHFYVDSCHSSEQGASLLKRPKWIDKLQSTYPIELDTIILALNCAAMCKSSFWRNKITKDSQPSLFNRCMKTIYEAFSIIVASISSLLYSILRIFCRITKKVTMPWACVILSNTRRNTQIRWCQVVYWPIFIQNKGMRLQPCVEFAEKASLNRHCIWSSIAADLLIGNMIGLPLLFHANHCFLWITSIFNGITDSLRMGCVWLMGAPAGFKLNTELASAFGISSLMMIQIWSNFGALLNFLSVHFIRTLALAGIIFGATIPFALISDAIHLCTLHISTLHWVMSVLYSRQIQALAALSHLFRGKKWNPLRQRLDSYHYSVEQHIVGSLLFTPILLLLPTTCVFYLFFTILHNAISLSCLMIEVVISAIHCTPYFKLFIWLKRPSRFPAGIWFEFATSRHSPRGHLCYEGLCGGARRCNLLVSILHGNFLSLGEVLLPHYEGIFFRISDVVTVLAREAVTGKRIAPKSEPCLPSMLPWACMPVTEYWWLCHDSVLSCFST